MKKYFCLLCIFFILIIVSEKSFAFEEILIIFDSSVSMLEPFGTTPKYIMAANAAKKEISKINSDTSIGLRIIGLSLDAGLLNYINSPEALCKATELAVPIKSQNQDNLYKSLESLFPLGTTPLTYALSMAITYDFTPMADLKHIILVTDGAESCDGDPCKYIQDIMKYRNDIKIDIIAIGVNAEDLKQLKCLSDTTFGSIINIKSSKEIDSAFSTFLTPSYPIYKPDFDDKSDNSNDVIYKNYLIEILN